jgi:hypothetical protein
MNLDPDHASGTCVAPDLPERTPAAMSSLHTAPTHRAAALAYGARLPNEHYDWMDFHNLGEIACEW